MSMLVGLKNVMAAKPVNMNAAPQAQKTQFAPIQDTFVKSASAKKVGFGAAEAPKLDFEIVKDPFALAPFSTSGADNPITLTGAKEVKIESDATGNDFKSIFVAPKPGKPTILYIHENNANVAVSQDYVKSYVKQGFGALMLEPEGSGKNSGKATEKSVVGNGIDALNFLDKQGIKNQDVIIVGHGIGGVFASKIAARADNPVKGLVLECTPPSYAALLKDWSDKGTVKGAPGSEADIESSVTAKLKVNGNVAPETKVLVVNATHNLQVAPPLAERTAELFPQAEKLTFDKKPGMVENPSKPGEQIQALAHFDPGKSDAIAEKIGKW